MGVGLPFAIGAKIARPEELVIDFDGDGSFQMTLQELATVVKYKLDVKIVILNNGYLGMVRQWQELLHGSRYSESYSDALPDFVKLAESFHAKGLRATKLGELDRVIAEMLAHDGPVVAEISVDEFENVFPMIPSGAAHNEMILGAEQSSQAAGITEEGMMLV